MAKIINGSARLMPMVRLDNVTKVYPNGSDALLGVSFELTAGEFAFLVGPSGSGKSTITKLLTGEIAPTEGTVLVDGVDIGRLTPGKLPEHRRQIGVVFQDYRLITNKTVYDNVAFSMRVIGASNREIRKRVPYVLDIVKLDKKSKNYPLELSGGEQQRVAIARALVNNPKLIIADEPTGNLDYVRSLEIMTLLKRINELNTTVLVVTHAKELVEKLGGRVIAINHGRIFHDGNDGHVPNFRV